MIGIVLWYNSDKHVGLVWCEDQGPLAYIAPEIVIPENADGQTLVCGDQVTFAYVVRDKVRYVSRIETVLPRRTSADPRAVLAAYHGEVEAPHLRVVA